MYFFIKAYVVEAVQKSTHIICIYNNNQKEYRKNIINNPLIQASANLTLKCAFIRYIFY